MTETPSLYERCVAFATQVHEGQFRKGKDIPYIGHCLAVVRLLTIITDDHEIWSAGVLHDTVEDCRPYGSVTLPIIEELAGERVARMVGDVTEPDRSLSWDERKQQALDHIVLMQKDSLLVKSADITANLTELNNDLKDGDPVEIFGRFNAGREKTVLSYYKRYLALFARWPENPLLPQLKKQIDLLLKFA